jgi:hypothetical protein
MDRDSANLPRPPPIPAASYRSDGGGSPAGDGGNPFADSRARSQTSHRTAPANPFQSPDVSRPPSSFGSSSGIAAAAPRAPNDPSAGPRYFHSRRVKKGEIEKPWLDNKDSREKFVTILPVLGVLIGLGLAGFLVWDGINSVVKHNYCMVLDDSFDTFNTDIWTKEVQVGGFG